MKKRKKIITISLIFLALLLIPVTLQVLEKINPKPVTVKINKTCFETFAAPAPSKKTIKAA